MLLSVNERAMGRRDRDFGALLGESCPKIPISRRPTGRSASTALRASDCDVLDADRYVRQFSEEPDHPPLGK